MLRKSRALDGLSEMVRTLTSNRGDDPTAPSCTYSFCELVRYEVTCTHGQQASVVEKPHSLRHTNLHALHINNQITVS